MASNNNNNVKIHEQTKVFPPSSTQKTTTPLTYFDIFWLRFHPVERVFFYTLPNSHSHPSFFFQKLVPILKSSFSLTLQDFLPLAGNIVWPLESQQPIIEYTPNDGVSLIIAESDANFNYVTENSSHEASLSRCFVPHLESTDSFASIISVQITLFPESGFSIGISTHHAVLDGKSSTMFIKAWAYLCNKTIETVEPPTLLPELKPLFDREIIKDNGLGDKFTNNWKEIINKMFPNEKGNERCLKILPFEPKLEDYVRATFKLTREDLDKIKKMVLSKWELLDTNEINSKPKIVSSFVLTCAYSLVCMAKAIHGVEKEKEKFGFAFTVDCRARLEPPVPNNYFGNCVWAHLVDTKPLDYINEDGVFLVAKCIHEKIKMITEKGVLDGASDMFDKFISLATEKLEMMGVAGSNRFGVYEIDFGWGRPSKVEIVSADRGLTIALAESKDSKGGVEVGIVQNKHVMDLFKTLFVEGLCIN